MRTFFQIAMPLLFIAILVFLRAFEIKNEYKPNVTYPAFEVNKLPSDVSKLNQIAFSPNTSDVQVMDGVFEQLGFTRNSSVPFNSEEDMVSSLVSLQGNDKTFLGGIVFNTSLDNNNIIYKIRLSSEKGKGLVQVLLQPGILSLHFQFYKFKDQGTKMPSTVALHFILKLDFWQFNMQWTLLS